MVAASPGNESQKPVSKLDTTLAERGGRYGDFRFNAEISQALKDVCHRSPNWAKMPPFLREGLDLMFTKVSRMLSGDWTYVDNPHDIIGYAKLMEDLLSQDAADPDVERPRIVDLNYLDVQSIFDYLLGSGVGPEEFRCFCSEHSITLPPADVPQPPAPDSEYPYAPVPDDHRADRLMLAGKRWWVYQYKRSRLVHHIVDVSASLLKSGINTGVFQVYECPQDAELWPFEELGAVYVGASGDVIYRWITPGDARNEFNREQDDGA